jgi:hypothetical protein
VGAGDALVTVRTDEPEIAGRAAQIMDRFNPLDLDLRSPGTDTILSDPYEREPVDEELANSHDELFTSPAELGERAHHRESRHSDPALSYGTQDSSLSGDAQYPDASGTKLQWSAREDEQARRIGSEEERPTSKAADEMHGQPSFTTYEPDFRQHYSGAFTQTDLPYDYFRPAYRYGFDLANSERFRDSEWGQVEPEARRAWEETNPENPWEEYRAAVREGWNLVKSMR